MSTIFGVNTWQPKMEHQLSDPRYLEKQLEIFEGTAIKFASDFIEDAHARSLYQSNIQRVSLNIMEEVKKQKIPVSEASRYVNSLRNQIMMDVRSITSTHGLARAQSKKMHGMSYEKTLERYNKTGKPFNSLSKEQKSKIYYKIIESGGRDNIKISISNRRLEILGKITLLMTATLAIYAIANADNHAKESIRQGVAISGGVAGGILASLGVSTVCGPGAPVCAIALILAGSISGGILASEVNDMLDEEYEEWTKWNIQ